MSRSTFRQRVLSLAALLVTSVQLLTLVPVLNAVKADVEQRARQTVSLGGAVFEEFMRNRSEQLRTTVDVLASDFGFKQAVASGDTDTIRSVLINHSGRAGADIAMLLDLDGNVVASSRGESNLQEIGELRSTVVGSQTADATQAVLYADRVPHQSMIVPLRAPLPIAWVVMGFQIDRSLANRIRALTGLDVSFVDRDAGTRMRVVESTMPIAGQQVMTEALRPLFGNSFEPVTVDLVGAEYLTVMRPFSEGSGNVQVALQLSLTSAMARYRSIRTILLLVTLVSLLAAVAGTYWLARTVTEPVSRLVEAARRMRSGVYTEPIDVPKTDELGELARSFNTMQEAIAEREERIAYQAYHDALSGLPNREHLLQILEPQFASEAPLTVVNFAIDRFGQIASSLGHNASDKVLKLVAEILRRNLRDAQHLAHLGGNEFVMAFAGADTTAARRWVEHLGHLLHAGISLEGANISLQARAGIAHFPEHSDNGPDLLRRAAVARSHALASHEQFAIFEPGEEEQHRRQIKIIGDFPAAVTGQQLLLYLQPKISCATHAVIGAEALVRWEHPSLGRLLPDHFVDVIERAGSIAHLSRWVINEAVRCCRDWRDSGLELAVAINLSVHDLVDQNLPYNLLDVVKSHGLKASDVVLEITESAVMHNVSRSIRVLECIQDLGFGIALDDFGTGQSSLTQLRRLPLDEVKIDKSFVMNMTDPKDDVIVRATIELAHNLGFRVVGEGVETAALLARLVELGCEYAQGYYISKPVPADAFIAWVQRWQQAHDTNIVRLRRSRADRA